MPDFSDRKTLEKYSSACTLSDMEIFIFPELFFPLVIADIMSPLLWRWRDDPWFSDMHRKNFISRVNRIKQYIIDNYVFNLDLETWGLTEKEKETARFSDFFNMEILKQSNALFGYEGDRYYFDIDIRRHFGLDKYDSSVIPYWKTETLEAMTAFRHKEHFTTGAGECVSLAALYAAAMFVVGEIPLEKIFMMATPLHSQNFIDEKEGLLTNNRRIMTKNMWFNGTSLSGKARRALENEKVTIVSHITGYIHTVYNRATINRDAYLNFTHKLNSFVKSPLTPSLFINLLRFKPAYKCLFQYHHTNASGSYYITLEKLFEYEHSSKCSFNEETRAKLIAEIDGEEFFPDPLPGKIMFNDVESFIRDFQDKTLQEAELEFISRFPTDHTDCMKNMFSDLRSFLITEPRLPSPEKEFCYEPYPALKVTDTRNDIIRKITDIAGVSEMALLSLYAYRDMDNTDWRPFIKAAIERNPVCLVLLAGKPTDEVFEVVSKMKNKSIYDSGRMAQPDEVWNFMRGDGAEKAILMANVIMNNDPDAELSIVLSDASAVVSYSGKTYHFATSKSHNKKIHIRKGEYSVS
jgi:YHS domain-containing protein